MLGSCRALLCSLVVLLVPAAASAQLEPTTEFGYTVSGDDLINAMLESQKLWPAIRKHIVSEKFGHIEEPTRKQASEFLAKIDDTISRRLIGAKDDDVRDAVVFLSMRLRKFSLLRDLRTELADDAVFFRLKEQWEDGRYRANMLAKSERAEAVAEVARQLDQAMSAAKLPAPKQAAAQDAWRRLASITEAMYSTKLGELIITFEREAKEADPKLKNFMRCVVRAADWAIITKPAAQEQTRSADFLKAWDVCDKHDQSLTASLR